MDSVSLKRQKINKFGFIWGVTVMKILNFGSCNIDFVYNLDHIVAIGETETSNSMQVFPGGKGLNQSVALAKAGMEVYHAGCIGTDGEMLTDVLESNGVDISNIKKVDEKTGHAIIQVSSKGDNSIFLYPGSNAKITEEFVDEVLDKFQKGDMLLLQNEINKIDYIIEKAYKKGMYIIFNPSPYNDEIKNLDFNMLSYIILNEVEMSELTQCDNPKDGLKYFSKNYPKLKIVLTLGSEGCMYSDTEKIVFQPSFKVNAVDTTAAGDTFTGYFFAQIAMGNTVEKSLKIASVASAIAVSRKGASVSIPMLNEVLAAENSFQSS